MRKSYGPFELIIETITRFKGGRMKVRGLRESPIVHNLIKYKNSTQLGKTSLMISQRTHSLSLFYFTRMANFGRLFWVRRWIQLLFTTFGCAIAGFWHASIGNNLLVIGYQSGFVQASDYSAELMVALGQDEKKKC